MTEGSLDERDAPVREGQYEHTSRPTPSPISSSPSSFPCIFIFFALYFLFCKFHRDQLSKYRRRQIFSLDLSFLDQITPAPQSSIHPHSDLDVDATHSTISHFLGLDLLSLSTSHKDVFCVALAVLALVSKVPKSKVFILVALAHTYFVFSTLDRALKSNMEISSKLDALKRQKTEFDQAQLAKKQATQRLNELYTEYDAQKECINMLN